ncbi:MAG: phosphatidylserine decarboxylase [Gammaproteobacteria bacterium]
MATKKYAYIARESYGKLAIVGLCAVTLQVALGAHAAAPAWLVLVVLLYMFRDPTQSPPSLPLAVVSPIHGQILEVGPTWDPWIKRPAEHLKVQTLLFDIRSIYAPIEGKIMEQWSAVPDAEPNEETPPRSSAYWIRTDEDDDIVLVISRGSWGGQISLRYSPGERVGQGRRIGYADFGCSVSLYMPPGSGYEVTDQDHVAAGSDVVGTLVHLTRMANPKSGSVDVEGEQKPDAMQ